MRELESGGGLFWGVQYRTGPGVAVVFRDGVFSVVTESDGGSVSQLCTHPIPRVGRVGTSRLVFRLRLGEDGPEVQVVTQSTR